MNVSVCIIAKNEEKHLKECLESVRFADEVILVDTGSTDNTLNIAKEFSNVKIFRKKFNIRYFKKWKLKKLFHFSNARNFALSKATKDWILIIDADERVHNPVEIKALIEGYPEVIAWRLDQVVKIGDKETPCSSTRLWRNNYGIMYEKIVHETVDEYLDRRGLRAEKCDARIYHVGFDNPAYNKIKAQRVIDAYEYEKHPYMWYYLGVCYVQLEEIEKATDCFNKALLVPMADNIKAHAHAILGDIYRQSADFYRDMAFERLADSKKLAPEQNMSYMVEAELLRAEGKKSQAHKLLKRNLLNRDTMKTQMHQDILLDKKQVQSMVTDYYI